MLRTTISVLVLSLGLSGAVFASDIEDAEKAVSSATEALQKMYNDNVVAFKLADGETTFLKALMNLNKAQASIAKAKAASVSTSKIDQLVADARVVQKIMGSYLGTKDMFAYDLKREGVAVQIDASIATRLAQKLPFIGGVSGSIRLNPGAQVVSQFNSLKAEYYGLLVEAAALNPADARVSAMAKWGNETKVRYPGGSSFGVEIISTQELWNLNLKN